jgi:hypothetical protein
MMTGEEWPTLRLIGALTSSEELPAGGYRAGLPSQHEMIYGLCEKTDVTLIDCHTSVACVGVGPPERWRQSLTVRLMLAGIRLADPGEACFDQIVVGVDQLLTWSGLTGISEQSLLCRCGVSLGSRRAGRLQPPGRVGVDHAGDRPRRQDVGGPRGAEARRERRLQRRGPRALQCGCADRPVDQALAGPFDLGHGTCLRRPRDHAPASAGRP